MDLISCIKCQKKVCTALKLGGTGCVLKETIPKDMVNAFKCPDCCDGPMNVCVGNSNQQHEPTESYSIYRHGFKAMPSGV